MSRATPQFPAASIEEAVAILKRGGLAAFPTETVYGLGADARNAAALARLYKVKGRPVAHPVIVHIASREAMAEWARDIPPFAEALAARFWPGPLTLVLKRAEGVADAITGGQDTIGLRVPAHPIALELLGAFGGGIAAPSANRFGRISPTTAVHVHADLGADVDAIIDGGNCDIGIESTIIDCSGEGPVLLRPGKILAADIEAVTGLAVTAPGEDAPRAPGTLAVHYAPRAKVRLLRRTEIIEALTSHKGKRLAALALEVSVPRLPAAQVIVVPAIAASYARSLYANLRALDATGADLILVELPPETPSWAGVRDRLSRAARTG
jgi:L-threonylcarbamoyladenylate synthase